MKILNFEEFYYEMWDYVSENVVDDGYWYKNEASLKEFTHGWYRIYLNTTGTNNELSPKILARLLEIAFLGWKVADINKE